MKFTWQELATLGIAAVAAWYLLRHAHATWRKSASHSCDGCDDCPSEQTDIRKKPLISLDVSNDLPRQK